jgi:hypothetical protein
MNNNQQEYQEIIVKKMVLDKFFSVFLEENPLDEETPTTPEWQTYKQKLKEYITVSNRLKVLEYRLSK